MLHPFDVLTRAETERRAREAEGLSMIEQREEIVRSLLDDAFYGDDPEDRIATIITMLKFNTALTVVVAAFMTTAFAVAVTLVLMLG